MRISEAIEGILHMEYNNYHIFHFARTRLFSRACVTIFKLRSGDPEKLSERRYLGVPYPCYAFFTEPYKTGILYGRKKGDVFKSYLAIQHNATPWTRLHKEQQLGLGVIWRCHCHGMIIPIIRKKSRTFTNTFPSIFVHGVYTSAFPRAISVSPFALAPAVRKKKPINAKLRALAVTPVTPT